MLVRTVRYCPARPVLYLLNPTNSVDISKAMFEVGPYIDSDLAVNIT
jgi:hypothetical protein